MDKNTDGKFQSSEQEKQEKAPVFATELWFSAEEDELQALRSRIKSGELTATVRLGDRSSSTSDPKGSYEEGRYITLKLRKSDKSFDEFQKEAVVLSSGVKKLGEILPEDLRGTLFDGKTKENLRRRLEEVYGRSVNGEDAVTIVRFEYQDALRGAEDLMRNKILSLARQPKSNPENLDFERYTLPLLEHDYPAKTAAMWNEAYETFGIKAGNGMLVGNPEFARQILEVLRRDQKYIGGGAGVGFKDEAIKYVDELDPLTQAIGSINFILKTPDGRLRGYNTDGIGYAESLEALMLENDEELNGKKAVILGAGGTGNPITFALVAKGVDVVVLNRTVSKAEALRDRANAYFQKELVRAGGLELRESEIADADVVVSTIDDKKSSLDAYSAIGVMEAPVTQESIRKNLEDTRAILGKAKPNLVVSDIRLRKQQTATLQQAESFGFKTLDGVPMVINQGVEAFWILYGEELHKKGITKEKVAEVMRKAVGLQQ